MMYKHYLHRTNPTKGKRYENNIEHIISRTCAMYKEEGKRSYRLIFHMTDKKGIFASENVFMKASGYA